MIEKRNVNSWYQSEERVREVKRRAVIIDLDEEIESNMKIDDLRDLNNYMIQMINHAGCKSCTINLSYAKVNFTLIEANDDCRKNVYKVEILDRYAYEAYVVEELPFYKLHMLVLKTLKR